MAAFTSSGSPRTPSSMWPRLPSCPIVGSENSFSFFHFASIAYIRSARLPSPASNTTIDSSLSAPVLWRWR